MAEIGATAGWCEFNVRLAAGMLREAAAMTTQVTGEVIPSDQPGRICHDGAAAGRRGARHRALERADHPRRARDRDAARLRQHRDPQGLRAVSGHPPADRHCAARRRPAGRRRQRGHQCAGGRRQGGRGADLAPGGAARELHRLDPHRPAGGGNRGALPQADPARARRQGAADRARRRRPRRGGERGRLRRLRQSGTGLHVDRAHRGRPEGGRSVPREIRRQGARAAGRRSARRRRGARLAGQPGRGRARARAHRRRAGERRARSSPAARSPAPS